MAAATAAGVMPAGRRGGGGRWGGRRGEQGEAGNDGGGGERLMPGPELLAGLVEEAIS